MVYSNSVYIEVLPETDVDLETQKKTLKLLENHFRTGMHMLEWWRWKHVANPFGPSMVTRAWYRKELVGVWALWRCPRQIHKKKIMAWQAGDTIIAPSWRGKGLFRKMVEKALDRVDPPIIFNFPNKTAIKKYLNMGWKQVKLLRLVYFNQPLRFISEVLRLKGSIKPFRVFQCGKSVADMWNSWSNFASQEFWSDCQEVAIDRIDRILDPVFLQYRHLDGPIHQRHFSVAIKEGDSLVGFILYRIGFRGKLKELNLVDVRYCVGKCSLAMFAIRNLLVDENPDICTSVASPGSDLHLLFKKLGFIPIPKIFNFTVRASETICEKGHYFKSRMWRICGADIDTT